MDYPTGVENPSWVASAVVQHLESRGYREPEPLSARIIGILFTLFTAGATSLLFCTRVAAVQSWTRLPYIRWLVIIQYAFGFIFTMFSSIVQYGFDANTDFQVCNVSAMVCILLYAIMKLFYLFLADRLHVVSSTAKTRRESKLFMVHAIGISVCILILGAVFVYMRLYESDNGLCIIGVKRVMMVIGVVFDVLINVYLTSFFLFYLTKNFNIKLVRSSRGQLSLSSNDASQPLRADIKDLTLRTTIGLLISLVATIANLVTMTIMLGEVIWLCFLTCKADLLLGVFVLYYVTSTTRRPTPPASGSSRHTQFTDDPLASGPTTDFRTPIAGGPIGLQTATSTLVGTGTIHGNDFGVESKAPPRRGSVAAQAALSRERELDYDIDVNRDLP